MADTLQETITKYLNSGNLLKGLLVGLGLRYAIETKSNLLEIICAVLAPGFYCGFNFFEIYMKYRQ